MREEETIIPQELKFQIQKIASRSMINPLNITLTKHKDPYTDHIILECVRRVCYIESTESISYPADWWEALKARWFPSWAKRKWPIRYVKRTAMAMFPNLEIPSESRFVHYFTFNKQEDYESTH